MGAAVYLGIDVGSVSTNLVVLDASKEVISTHYRYTQGDPIGATRSCLGSALGDAEVEVRGVGVTGSGRNLLSSVVGGDIQRTEIIAHYRGALATHPNCRTIIEIGGQDSKIIIVRDNMIVDFNMNSICAAGTGAFLDSQARRLGIEVKEIGSISMGAQYPATISGRCTVFAESDMIHRQQQGVGQAEILAGLCRSLVKNYLNNCAKGKPIEDDILFLGGVSNNSGIVAAFERELGRKVHVPRHNDVMGAKGMAHFARAIETPTAFKGLSRISQAKYRTRAFTCEHCDNQCEIVEVLEDNRQIAYWGSGCERWLTAGSQCS